MTYPIAKSPMGIRYQKEDPLFCKNNTHHVVLHSIHPRNDTALPMNGNMLSMDHLVVVISCLARKMSRSSNGCGLPTDRLDRVAVPCDAFFVYAKKIVGTKVSTRFLFDNVERDGNGSGFVNRVNVHLQDENKNDS